MSRHGYVEFDGDDPLQEGRWRGAVLSALRGKRGQSFFKEMLQALDEMPIKALAARSFTRGGEICALGSVAVKRGIDVSDFEAGEGEDSWDDEIDHDALAEVFGIAPVMAREIMYENDEGAYNETPEHRWKRVRAWVVRNIRSPTDGEADAN
jgi:hypothetical protein